MRKRRILIIDDELDLCLLLQQYFVRKGHEVRLRHKLKDGIKDAKEWKPDDLFLDNNLPDGIGWDLFPELQKNLPEARFFLISGFNPSFPAQALENTNVARIEKPLSYKDLDTYYN